MAPCPPSPVDPTAAPVADAARARQIRRRLMDRVADDDHSHLSIGPHDAAWQPLLDGVDIKVLHARGGVMSYLLRLAPGARLPAHRHPIDEECMVLEGQLRVGSRLELGPGAYHLAHAGALHPTITTTHGATIFLRGAVPDAGHLLG